MTAISRRYLLLASWQLTLTWYLIFLIATVSCHLAPVSAQAPSDSPSTQTLLSDLLTHSASTPLIDVLATEFERFACPPSSHNDTDNDHSSDAGSNAHPLVAPGEPERSYALVLFLTASRGCTSCAAVERELPLVAQLYEQARYALPHDNDPSRSTPPTSPHPLHRIFFLKLDAHRNDRTPGDAEPVWSNLDWFRKQEIKNVPEIILIKHTTKPPPIHKTLPDASQLEELDNTPKGRWRRRIRAMEERIAMRLQRSTNLTESALSESDTDASTPSIISSGPCWRSPQYSFSYPLSAGADPAKLVAFIRSHTEGVQEGEDSNDAELPNDDEQLLSPLPPHRVTPRSGVRLAVDFAALAAAKAAADAERSSGFGGLLLSFFTSVEPFAPSIALFACIFVGWKMKLVGFWALPAVFYLWAVSGAMNNIIKKMPLIGMGQSGPMFFYPGHGSFVFESVIIAVLYAYSAISFIALNRLKLWHAYGQSSRSQQPQAHISTQPSEKTERVTKTALTDVEAYRSALNLTSNDSADVASASSTLSSSASSTSTPTSTPASTNVPLQPGQIRASKQFLESHARRRQQADMNLFDFPPNTWILFLVITFGFAFSLMRTVYTRKNGAYRFGYLL